MPKSMLFRFRSCFNLCVKYFLLMLVVTAFIFFFLRLAPLDPTGLLMSPMSTPADILHIKHRLGLDLPIWKQYLYWVDALLHGNAGMSYVSGEQVTALILHAVPVTFTLITITLIVSVALAFFFAILAFYYRENRLSEWVDHLNNLFLCIPDFLWSILLVFIFGISFHLLPTFGLIDPASDLTLNDKHGLLVAIILGGPSAWLSLAAHLLLPAMALIMGITPLQMKNLFNQLTRIYQRDFIYYAQLRGQTAFQLLTSQAIPNTLAGALSLLSNQASMLVGGTLLVETLFGLPGLGMLMIKALGNQDLPLIEGIALCYILLVISIQLITGTCMYLVDPRCRGNV
ncbi:ABC transporter permease [Citrobacter freundii]